jgi:hypothetical protein
MGTKGNLVLYLDKELVEKSKSLGFNLSKTFDNRKIENQSARSRKLNSRKLQFREIKSIDRTYSSFFSFFDFSIASCSNFCTS